MPQISNEEAQAHVYDGVTGINQRLSFRERLMERFQAHEWVRIINIDDEPFYWQYLPQHSESFEFTADGRQKIVNREPVEAWTIMPGSSEVVIGENAFIMIEALYKKLIAKGFLLHHGENPERSPGRNFNWSDGKQQEDIINKIFLGKETPEFGSKSNVKPTQSPSVTASTGRLRQTN